VAFVRWRGNSATLLTTVYEQGRSRQVRLAALGCGYQVPSGIREEVTERFPEVNVDWRKGEEAMAQGPPTAPPLTGVHLTYLQVEQHLREWATTTPYPGERQQLLAVATLLSNWLGRESTDF
jgi:hypothetical protein